MTYEHKMVQMPSGNYWKKETEELLDNYSKNGWALASTFRKEKGGMATYIIFRRPKP